MRCARIALLAGVLSTAWLDAQTPATPANLPHHSDSIEVQANLAGISAGAGGELTLHGLDLLNLSTVLANDPFRALQGVPGVASNDDFEARFSLRGADFNRIGIYVDGVPLHDALHSLEGTDLSGSASVFNAGMVAGLDLYEDAYSEHFSDATAGVIDVHLRDGDTNRYSLQLSASLATAGILASGPLGAVRNCSWIAGFRKSYLQYLISETLTDPSMAFGIQDGQGRLNCRVSDHNSVSLDVIESQTALNRSSIRGQLGDNALMDANQQLSFVNAGWTFAPSSTWLLQNHLAWTLDTFDAQNPFNSPLGNGHYQEIAWTSDVSHMWNANDGLSAGVALRQIRDTGFSEDFDLSTRLEHFDCYHGSGLLGSGYVQETWTAAGGRLHLTGSGGWNHQWTDRETVWTPQLSAAYRLLPGLELQAGWAQYAQFPPVSVLASNLGSPSLPAMRTTLATAGLQQRFGDHSLLRVVVYDRQDRNMLYQPWADPRLLNGSVFIPPLDALYTDSLREHAHGIEVRLQRSSRKGLNGWVSYAYGHSQDSDSVTGASFPSDWDQRHTLNAYSSYALKPTLNLSARWTYGSGFPVPGYLVSSNGAFYLSADRNSIRPGPYQRLDVRMNKVWNREHWKTTLYTEVMNVTNKINRRFGSLDGYESGPPYLAWVTTDTMFPILPAVGLLIER